MRLRLLALALAFASFAPAGIAADGTTDDTPDDTAEIGPQPHAAFGAHPQSGEHVLRPDDGHGICPFITPR